MVSFKTRSQSKLSEIEKLLFEYKIEARYPGKDILEETKKLLNSVITINEPIEFFRFIDSKKDDFLDSAEDIEPIVSFFEGEQKTIFAKAYKYIDIFNNSKTYVVDRDLIDVVEKIKAIVTKKNPYRDIHKLPELLNEFTTKHLALLEKEAEPIREDVDRDWMLVCETIGDKEYGSNFKNKFSILFDELKNKLETSNEVAAVKNIRYESDALKTRCLNELSAYEKKIQEEKLRAEKAASAKANTNTGETATKVEVKPVVIKSKKNVSLRQVTGGQSVAIEKEEDIDKFLTTLKSKLMRELDKDTIVNLLM